MSLDAIIISSVDDTSYNLSSPLRLKLNGKIATIQRIKAILQNNIERVDASSDLHTTSWQHLPKLNGISIYNYLTSRGVNCDLIDNYAAEKNRFIELVQQKPKFVIISTTFIVNKRILSKLTSEIKSLYKNATIIAGGPFVYSSYLLYKRKKDINYDTDSPQRDYLFLNGNNEPQINFYVIGSQGLKSLLALMTALKNNEPTSRISNIAFFQDGKLYTTKIEDESSFDYINIDWDSLPEHILAKQVMSVQASNGCPFKCKFCNFVKNKYAELIRPLDDIIQDFKTLQDIGIKYARFVDDNFRLGKPDLNEFCQKLIEAGNCIRWQSFMRLSNLTGMDLDLLKKAGCCEIHFGLESASQTVLKNMNKQIDPNKYHKTIVKLLAIGINVTASFVIGFPGETLQTAQYTINFIKSINSKNFDGRFRWHLFRFVLAPLSPIYEDSERKNYNLFGYMHNWRHDTMDSDTAYDIIKKAYMEIQNSGPAYTGDDLNDLNMLSSKKIHEFEMTRFLLSKDSLEKEISYDEIHEAFSGIFN